MLSLLAAPLLPGLLNVQASAAPVPTPPATSKLVLTNPAGPTDDFGRPNPNGTLLTVTMTPDPRAGVTAGDHVKVTFSGMQPFIRVSLIGMCPTVLSPDAPVRPTIGTAQCNAAWPTGINAPIDATGQTAALSTTTPTFPLFARASDSSVTVDFLIGSGKPNSPGVFLPGQTDGKPNADYPTCDQDNACTIGFGLSEQTTSRSVWSNITDAVVKPKPPLGTGAAGCGQPGSASLSVAGAERAQGEVAAFNTGLCAGSGQPLPMNLVGDGEGSGLRSLGDTADLTFAGSSLLAAGDAPATAQPSVLTPVGLNAVVLAEIGGIEAVSNTPGEAISNKTGDTSPLPSGSPLPLPRLNLTQAQVAKILVHAFPTGPGPGAPPFSGPPLTGAPAAGAPDLYTSIVTNPANAGLGLVDGFDNRGYGLPYSQAPTTVYPTGQDSTPAAMSAQLHQDAAAKTALVVPDLPTNVTDGTAGTAVPEFSDFSAVVNSTAAYVRQTASVGGIYSSIFGKDTLNPGAVACPNIDPTDAGNQYKNSCAKFVVTDLVTATSLGLPVAAVQNGGGSYITPDAAGLQAAAAAGKTDANGLFTSSAGAGGAAYPFTFVEYAVSQASPLLASDCTARTDAQDSLSSVVSYLAANSQSSLTPGLAPLTSSLVDVAKASVAKVGASPTAAGPCKAVSAASVSSVATGAGGAASSSGGPGSSGSSAASLSSLLDSPAGLSGSADAAAVQLPTAETAAAVEKAADTVDIPVFGQKGPLGPLGPLAGLAGLVGITSGAGVIASNRLSGKTFGDIRSWAHRTFVGTPTIQELGP
ncbi:hypothetical protein GCM10027047_12300 [Rhodococcus aerolatus]